MIALTLAEAAELLDPPIDVHQLKAIVGALRWQPAAWRTNGRPGHPRAAYNWDDISALHQALLPFMR